MAQWLAQRTHNPLVAGSNPAGPTNFIKMKSILTSLFLFLSVMVFSQNIIVKRDIVTTSNSTATMKWDYINDKWNFENNNDGYTQRVKWEFTLYENSTGKVESGSVYYTVKTWKYDDEGEYPLIFMEVFNHTLRRDLEMMLMKFEDKFFVSVFDSQNKIVYYFAE